MICCFGDPLGTTIINTWIIDLVQHLSVSLRGTRKGLYIRPAVFESVSFAFHLICASLGTQLYLFCAYKTNTTRKVINIFKEGTWMSDPYSVITNLWALSKQCHVTSSHVTSRQVMSRQTRRPT